MTIDDLIVQFVGQRSTLPEPYFEIRTLVTFVKTQKEANKEIVTDPSVRRVLRRLRAQGKVRYTVMNKKTGQYRAEGVSV